MNKSNMLKRVSKSIIVLCAMFISILLCIASCGGGGNNGSGSNTVNTHWVGAWENDVELAGTFTLDMTITGSNLDQYGGSGTISGTVVWDDYKGNNIINANISGTWENDWSSNHYDLFEFSVSSSDGRLSLGAYSHYDTASELDNNTFVIDSFTLDSNNRGGWHTSPATFSEENVNITSAVLIENNWDFLDITYADGYIYAAVFDDPAYNIIRLDISDGSVQDVSVSCEEPYAIAYDGINTWVVGKANSGDIDYNLYLYPGTNFDAPTVTVVLSNGTSAVPFDAPTVNAISYSGSTLYYHNGLILMPVIGSINTATGIMTDLLVGRFDTILGLSRSTKIASTTDAYYTTYFAPGGVWCGIQKLNHSGSLLKSYYSPVDDTGPITINGSNLYIVQRNSNYQNNRNRLYVIDLE